MIELFLVILILLWVAMPFLLWYYCHQYRKASQENQKYKRLVQRLLSDRRITPRDVLSEGLDVPPFRPITPLPPDSGLWQPVQPHQPAAEASAAGIAGTRAGQPMAAPVPQAQDLLQQELQKLRALQADGVLTDAEFAAQKAKLFGAAPAPSPVQQAAPESKLPPKPETVAEPMPPQAESVYRQQPAVPEKPVSTPPMPQAVPVAAAAGKKNTTSAISVMLGVGVVLIILAGLLFVRTSWNALADFGKLMTLAAGSVLFFGTSALAYKVWHLKRTGMAFFSLGATFLPISMWAAGYLSLLGDGLSGGSNPWLLTIASAAFTCAAVVGVRISRMKGWGIASLIGVSAVYLCGMWALLPSYGAWTLSAAAFALLLTFLAKPLALRLPPCVGEVIGQFSMIYTLCAAVPMFIRMDGSSAWYGFAGFAAALAFIAPAVTCRLKQGSAVIMSLLTVYGFARVMQPLLEQDSLRINGWMFTALVCMITGVLLLVFITVNALPEDVNEGYHWMFRLITGVAIVILMGVGISGAEWNWMMLLGLALLSFSTLIPVLRTGNMWLRAYLAAEMLVLALGFSNTVLHSANASQLLTAALSFGCGILFLCARPLRSVFSDFLFPFGMAVCSMAAIFDYNTPLQWTTVAAIVLLGISAVWCFVMALEHRLQNPQQYCFSVVFVALLALFCSAVGEILLPAVGDGMFLIWTLLSAGIGLGLYYRTKRGFAGVRHCIFGLCTLLPLSVGVFASGCSGLWPFWLWLANTVIAVWVYRIYASHGKRQLAVAGFAAALYMAVQAVYFITQYGLDVPYDTRVSASFAAVSVILLALAAAVYVMIRKGLHFVGDYAVAQTARFVLPCAVVLYAILSGTVGSGSVWQILLSLIAGGLAAILFAGYAWQEKRGAAIASFGALLFLVIEACGSSGYNFLFAGLEGSVPLYGTLLIAFDILLMLAVIVYAIRRGYLSFCGDYAVDVVAKYVLPWNVFAYGLLSLVFVDEPLWQIILALTVGILAAILFADYAHREKRILTVASFGAVLLYALEATFSSSYDYLFQDLTSPNRFCSAVLICFAVLMTLGIVSLLIRRGKLAFLGDGAVDTVAQWMLPCTVAFYGIVSLVVAAYSPWQVVMALVAAVSAVLLFAGHAIRRQHNFSVASFAAALWMVLQASYLFGDRYLFTEGSSFPSLMLSGTVLLLTAAFVYLQQRGVIRFFLGSDAIDLTVRFAMPAAALFFGVALLSLPDTLWHGFYFIFGLLLCLAAWLVSDARSYVGSGTAVFSLILTVEALRQHCPWSENGFVAGMLLGYVILFALFCYLGSVLRQDEIPRGWVLTVAGGAVPLWLLFASLDSAYTVPQAEWMRFCVPMLLAAYTFHLGRSVLPDYRRRGCYIAAAALCMIALWMQPMFDFAGTYLDGKYHLLPLIGFGFVLRALYGKDSGGNWLFVFSLYAVIRLAAQALIHERPADLMTVLVCGLAIFIIAYYIKQKKWFLLGGVTLCGIAVRLSPGMQWWMYLLVAGGLLIVIAATNEMAKQRGESLKERVGRFWEDWEW